MDTVINWLCSLKNGEIISLVEIIVTIIIGIWIGVSVQKNLTTNRSVKDYFISESKEIRSRYRNFMNDIWSEKSKAKDIKAWFKIMTIRIDIFEKFLSYEYKLDPDITNYHNIIKKYITDTEEFNKNYKKEFIIFEASTKNDFIKLHRDLIKELTRNVIGINRARRKFHLRKKLDKIA